MIRRALLALALLEVARLVLTACCRSAYLVGYLAGYLSKSEPSKETNPA